MLLRNRGLGDTGAVASSFDTSFVGGATLTAAALGLALIVALKMFPPAESKPRGKKWVSGAWRSMDYEEWPAGMPKRRIGRGRSKAA